MEFLKSAILKGESRSGDKTAEYPAPLCAKTGKISSNMALLCGYLKRLAICHSRANPFCSPGLLFALKFAQAIFIEVFNGDRARFGNFVGIKDNCANAERRFSVWAVKKGSAFPMLQRIGLGFRTNFQSQSPLVAR